MKFSLRKWDKAYIPDIAEFANNPKIARNLRDAFPSPYTLKDAEYYVSTSADNDETRQICRAIVIDGKAAGSIGIFLGEDVYRKSGELGYWLAEEYWGNGIMSAAVKQLSAEAFENYDINRIFAEPFALNRGSRKVLEKAGFALEGIMKQGVFKNGKVQDYCVYALIK